MKIGKLLRAKMGTSSYEKVQSEERANNQKALQTINQIKEHVKHMSDVVLKDIATVEGIVTIIHCSSLVENMTMQNMIFTPLANHLNQIHQDAEVIDSTDTEKIVSNIVVGHTLLYFHRKNLLLSMDTFSVSTRAISTSEVESTVMGPQDSFTESLQTNISLIKRRIQNPKLKNEDRIIGTETNTKMSILYMEHIVNQENLEKVKSRIDKLDYPGYPDISILKQLIEDNPLSPFPQFYMTVKPDTAMHYLLDGRIVILMDNSQEVVICPTSFFEMFVSIEDYYNRWTTTSLLRMLRFGGFFLTIMMTPMYISTLTFHPEILPYELLVNLQESRSKVPFSPLLEVLFIELIIEVLREAGSRMPAKVGQTIGIVGGIVIGTAAVEAGLVSNILVVLVAISALLSFLSPTFVMSNTSRFIRYIFILSAGLFGLFGQMLAFAWLISHLLIINSLDTPFMTPIIPRKASDLLNSLIRFPTSYLKEKMGISRAQKK
ncbi:spore germination protein [Psychrobacillus sp.]|uniref:spore germination protein n=1 Tax=Psychrobacillus sp. TaxID=1871623 RepID=UPI0028BD7FBA|nr:spore germination protein [Psychrobacillus sp.]